MRRLELLAPARGYDYGVIAVDCGADALYVGGPAFGARSGACNTAGDIERLVDYAHRYRVRVYAALNTVIYEDELCDAERVARDVLDAGVDALIIQDPAYLMMGLGEVEFHASTQMGNNTAEWAGFLGEVGFRRVILERGLSLDEIKKIRVGTDMELECFVHGAICVGTSGKCYMSRSCGRRSGNRGGCTQPCRLPYDLRDVDGEILLRSKHVLSVKDLDLSARIPELIDAGVTSFKIEGRLKDENYIKNIVCFYRDILDREIAARDIFCRSSSGATYKNFTPDPARTFTRGGTEYMLDGKRAGVSSFDTPKAVGAYVGRVVRTDNKGFVLDTGHTIVPGDGVCWVSGGIAAGSNVNSSIGGRVYLNGREVPRVGTEIYRNFDKEFSSILKKAKITRKIPASGELRIGNGAITFTLKDDEQNIARATCGNVFEASANPETTLAALGEQLSRSGNTAFEIRNVEVSLTDGSPVPFMPLGAMNDLRREALAGLEKTRQARVVPEATTKASAKGPQTGGFFSGKTLGGDMNVTNSLAERFYRMHGAAKVEPGFDIRTDLTGETVMTTPYCLRRELGKCGRKNAREKQAPDLFITDGKNRFMLRFDCEKCQMNIIKMP